MRKEPNKHMSDGVWADRLDTDWLIMQKLMDKARRMIPGRWYRLYRIIGEYSHNASKAEMLERKLMAHYKYYARFEDRDGLQHCYTYGTLAGMIERPTDKVIIKEKRGVERNEY